MDKESALEKIAQDMILVGESSKFASRANSAVGKYLSPVLRTQIERRQFREEALGRTHLAVYAAMTRKSLVDLQPFLGDPENALFGYMVVSFRNVCIRQLIKWSTWDEDGTREMRVRTELDQPDGLDPAYFSEAHRSEDRSASATDETKIDELLSDLGLNQSEVDILKLHLREMTYVEMAGKFGGTPDKYRKQVNRAKEKAGLDDVSLLS